MSVRRIPILAVAMTMLLGLIMAATVVGQEGDGGADLDDIKEDVVRDLFDENGQMMNTDQRLARIAKEHAGGFGGYYFHDTDKSTVYVYMMLDPSQTESVEAAEGAFRAAYQGKRQVTKVIPVRGAYAFDELLEWFYALDSALVAEEIYPATGAALEISNRIRFGLEDMDQVEDARRVMADLGIPVGAVIFEEAQPELLANGDSVKAKWRPLTGGTQHNIRLASSGHCTIGFVTERSGVDGLVVASHCTNIDGDIGGLNDAKIYQPSKNLFQNNKVAEEEIDPTLQPISNSQCPTGYKCRYSDAAFADAVSEQTLDLGHVAKPESVGSLRVDPAGTTFEITREASGIRTGDTVYYIGATRGWRTAVVQDDCDYFQVSSYIPGIREGVRIICVGLALPNDGQPDPASGDSGGPVISPATGDDVNLVGTVFGRTYSHFYFSKVGYIYLELGRSDVWNSCVSGC